MYCSSASVSIACRILSATISAESTGIEPAAVDRCCCRSSRLPIEFFPKSVAVIRGNTVATLILCGSSYARAVSEIMFRAALVEAYIDSPWMRIFDTMELTFTIMPPPPFCISGTAACMARTGPRTFNSKIF